MEISDSGKYDANDAIGAVFTALADPSRRRIVERLRQGDETVSELAAELGLGTPSVSKHLTVLERAGLVSRHNEAQWRRCRLEGVAFERLQRWIDHYADLWSGSLGRLDEHLRGKGQP
ncbi:MAG: metalloregulator ArsR/SmtB family transcription factor [Actinomycetota bacterium]|nr:metalloregulator ArsR/SmtB family transcription factor [Actinomycetota bacterium]